MGSRVAEQVTRFYCFLKSVSRRINNGSTMRMTHGQIVIEYLLLFAVVAVLTVIGVAALDNQARGTMTDLYGKAVSMVSPSVEAP